MKEKETHEGKELLIKTFRENPDLSVVKICKLANVPRRNFYHFLNTDADFKRQILKLKQEQLSAQIATAV